MPVWLHATLDIVLSFAGAMGATLAGTWLNRHFGMTGFWAFIVVGACFSVGFNLPMLLFLKAVPARCRKCGGKTWGGFAAGTLVYTCGECGFVRRTRVEAD